MQPKALLLLRIMIGPQLRDLFWNWAVVEGGEFFVSVKACCYFLENESGIGLVYCKRGDGVGSLSGGTSGGEGARRILA